MTQEYQFTQPWFEHARPVWRELLPQAKPTRLLEIGSFEGASACFLIEQLAYNHPIELHCIDTWQGGLEHQPGNSAPVDMRQVEQRFHHNITLALSKAPHPVHFNCHKGRSADVLARLLADKGTGYFDFIYVDGSHQAADVLLDAVLSFQLLRNGGLLVFDDYLWSEPLPGGVDPLRCPKLAIDAFTTIYARQLRIVSAPLYQLFVQKNPA